MVKSLGGVTGRMALSRALYMFVYLSPPGGSVQYNYRKLL